MLTPRTGVDGPCRAFISLVAIYTSLTVAHMFFVVRGIMTTRDRTCYIGIFITSTVVWYQRFHDAAFSFMAGALVIAAKSARSVPREFMLCRLHRSWSNRWAMTSRLCESCSKGLLPKIPMPRLTIGRCLELPRKSLHTVS